MKTVDVSGRTVEEAIANGLTKLGINREQAEILVLEEPNKGFLGFIGHKNALVKVSQKNVLEEYTMDLLKQLLSFYKVKPNIKISEIESRLSIELTGDNMGILIGRRGDTLDALQYWLNLAVNRRTEQKTKVILDIEGYRNKRKDILINLAKKLSAKVKQTKRKVILEPMNPFERSIIHTALQNDQEIQTFSEGEEPFRKVVISLKR